MFCYFNDQPVRYRTNWFKALRKSFEFYRIQMKQNCKPLLSLQSTANEAAVCVGMSQWEICVESRWLQSCLMLLRVLCCAHMTSHSHRHTETLCGHLCCCNTDLISHPSCNTLGTGTTSSHDLQPWLQGDCTNWNKTLSIMWQYKLVLGWALTSSGILGVFLVVSTLKLRSSLLVLSYCAILVSSLSYQLSMINSTGHVCLVCLVRPERWIWRWVLFPSVVRAAGLGREQSGQLQAVDDVTSVPPSWKSLY